MLHDKGFIHRDIKPDNFVIGLYKKAPIIYMIDFGLAKRYIDAKTHLHIPYSQGKSLTGTARYASVNAHLGMEQSRRDDLESIGYLLIYLFKGILPWQGISGKTKCEKYAKIAKCKATTSIDVLCKGLPEEFVQYMQYCKSLKFDETPNYQFLRSMFSTLYAKSGHVCDGMMDWFYVDIVKV